ncbi:NLR family CARD domain-containing protein 4-like isoform X2 [Acanthaster planci]|uniref:NLR family CARD domain-containing protein 4-like isoform X2 n=1 Tax=Acanthaster planci TaxID=133434 RepID=A0A8B7XXF4_ACAPL|nr:NLR family CARD domain-containing protein 4-like isoform X2 [Acanthaster planci]
MLTKIERTAKKEKERTEADPTANLKQQMMYGDPGVPKAREGSRKAKKRSRSNSQPEATDDVRNPDVPKAREDSRKGKKRSRSNSQPEARDDLHDPDAHKDRVDSRKGKKRSRSNSQPEARDNVPDPDVPKDREDSKKGKKRSRSNSQREAKDDVRDPGVPKDRGDSRKGKKRSRSNSQPEATGILDDITLWMLAGKFRSKDLPLLASKFGIDYAEVTHLEADHCRDVHRQIYEVFIKWRCNQPVNVNQRESSCKLLTEMGYAEVADELMNKCPIGSDVQYGATARKWKERLQKKYLNEGSFVEGNPWNESVKLKIPKIFINIPLITGEGTTERTHASYEDILPLTTEEGEQICTVVLNGLAGTGKTIILKKIAYDWAFGKIRVLKDYDLVFLLEMRELKEGSDLMDAVLDQLLTECPNKERNALWTYIQQNPRKVLILLDGFDEMKTTPLSKSSFGSILKILSRKSCRGCTVLVSTRPSHFDTLVTKELVQEPFTNTRVTGFQKEHIRQYVIEVFKYFGKPNEAEGLLEEVVSYSHLVSLAETPMLLHWMCLLYKERTTLLEPVSLQYKNMFQFLCKRKNVSEKEMFNAVYQLGKASLSGLHSPDHVVTFKENRFKQDVRNVSLTVGILKREREFERLIPQNVVKFLDKTVQCFCAAFYLQRKHLKKDIRTKLWKIVNETLLKCRWDSDYHLLLRFCCGVSETSTCLSAPVSTPTCAFEIQNIFLESCQEDLSYEKEEGRLALHCYRESQPKHLPPEKFIRSFLTDVVTIENIDIDCLNSVTYFWKRVAVQPKDSDRAHLAEVKKLNITSCDFTRCLKDLTTGISAMTKLHHVTLCQCLTDKSSEHVIESLRNLCNLTTLNLSGNNLSKPLLWVQHLKHMKALKQLHLCNCSLNGQGAKKVIEALFGLAILTTLNLSGNNLGNTAEWCQKLKHMKALKQLHLCNCSLNGQGVKYVIEALCDLANVTTLNLSGNNLDHTAEWCQKLKHMKALKQLHLCNCSLNGRDVKHVAKSNLTELVVLDLKYNSLAGTAASWCKHMKHFKALQQLHLSHCSLNEQDKSHVSESLTCDLPELVNE